MEIKKIDLDDYGRRIFKANGHPGILDQLNLEITGWFAYFSEQLNVLELLEAKFWQDNKKVEGSKDKSDKELESMWKLTPDGEAHMRAVRATKTIEKLMSSLKASLRRAETEARNQN